MKIAVVGGGSTYTPELVDGFARLRRPGGAGPDSRAGLAVEELALIDPAADRLETVGRFSRRIFDHYGHPGRITWTTATDAGLDGADAVIVQLRVGGQAARISDETFPLRCGCVGQETTGAGGLAKALRTVPVVLDVAARAAERARPNAWIIDFTNPVGIVTRALLDAGHRAVGLCNVAIGFQRRFYCHDLVVRADRGAPTRGQRVAEIEAALLARYRDPALTTKPDLLAQRGGAYYSEAAVGLLAALNGHAPGSVHAVNLRNNGTLPNLDDDAVIEVSARVGPAGPTACAPAPLPADIAGLIGAVAGYERLAVDAALRGGRQRVYRALLAHPLVGQHEYAEALTDNLLAANAQHLAWAR